MIRSKGVGEPGEVFFLAVIAKLRPVGGDLSAALRLAQAGGGIEFCVRRWEIHVPCK